jgi:stringent starvation protein B
MTAPSFKPYLIRAMYEWCAEQRFSPYLAVAVDGSCKVPMAHVRNGQIVLDISMDATHQLELGLEAITFQARFGGVAQHLYVPINRVLGIFPEHDQTLGVFFEVSAESNETNQAEQNIVTDQAAVGKPRITRVK